MLPIPAKSMCSKGCVFLHQVFCVICLLRVHQADWIVNYMLSKIVSVVSIVVSDWMCLQDS